MRILIAEDDRHLRASVARGLKEASCAVDQAATGAAADALAATTAYDAIILDILLPEGNGVVVCRNIRERGSRVPILTMLTGPITIGDLVSDTMRHAVRRGGPRPAAHVKRKPARRTG